MHTFPMQNPLTHSIKNGYGVNEFHIISLRLFNFARLISLKIQKHYSPSLQSFAAVSFMLLLLKPAPASFVLSYFFFLNYTVTVQSPAEESIDRFPPRVYVVSIKRSMSWGYASASVTRSRSSLQLSSPYSQLTPQAFRGTIW